MDISFIERTFDIAQQKGWDKTYWAIDIHHTTIYPDYGDKSQEFRYYSFAKETLQLLSQRKDVVLMLFTCSWPKEIEFYHKRFKEDGIFFNYINENPEVQNEAYGYYDQKPYFNVLLDDKAGFNPEVFWKELYYFLLNK